MLRILLKVGVLSLLLQPALAFRRKAKGRVRASIALANNGSEAGPFYWLSSACATGLVENESAQTCYYDAPLLKASGLSSYAGMWDNQGSETKLSFDKNGLFRAEAQHIAELAAAMTDRNLTSYILADELKLLRHQTNMTRFEIFKDVVTRGKSRLFDFSAIVALKIPTMPHILEMQLGIVQMIASALQSGTIVIGGLGDTALVATLASINIHAAWVPVVGWTMAVFVGSLHLYETIHHYYEKLHHSEHFTRALALKSGCVARNILIEPVVAEKSYGEGSFYSPHFQKSCGEVLKASLVAQLVNTNAAMRRMFDEMGDVGQCLYPEYNHARRWSLIECAEAIYKPTLQTDGRPGILYAAVIMAASYGRLADSILQTPMYGDAITGTFGIDLPIGGGPREELRNLTCTPATDRPPMCVQVLVQHRAFEMTFLRFATAIRGYMKTFGRETHSPTMRSSQYPCRRIIVKPESGHELCKFQDKFRDWEGNAFNETDTCNETDLWEHEAFASGDEHQDGDESRPHDDNHDAQPFCEPEQLPEPEEQFTESGEAADAIIQPEKVGEVDPTLPAAAQKVKSGASRLQAVTIYAAIAYRVVSWASFH